MTEKLEQDIALAEEVRTSIRLIEAGLSHLQRIDAANDFYHLPMLLLANGFERLMKIIICLHHLRETGSYPTRKIFASGRKGHDLVTLLDDVISRCFGSDYLKRPAASHDVEYLRTDPQLRKLVQLLSDFGQAARYYHLDVVLGQRYRTDSPERTWQEVEMQALQQKGGDSVDRLKEPANLSGVYQDVAQALVVGFEKLARALVRLFTIGGLGDEAKRHTGIIGPFLYLMDSDLGKRDYSQNFRAWRSARSTS